MTGAGSVSSVDGLFAVPVSHGPLCSPHGGRQQVFDKRRKGFLDSSHFVVLGTGWHPFSRVLVLACVAVGGCNTTSTLFLRWMSSRKRRLADFAAALRFI